MAKLGREERAKLAETRLIRVLRPHVVANARTLEQKISDAGPFNQRIDPHVLTVVRNRLVEEGAISRTNRVNAPWFHVSNTPPEVVAARLDEQVAVFNAYNAAAKRTGQSLEIATFRALSAAGAEFFGRYKDLDKHDDSQTYTKEEPPQHIGNLSLSGDENLDFIIRHPTSGHLGVECSRLHVLRSLRMMRSIDARVGSQSRPLLKRSCEKCGGSLHVKHLNINRLRVPY